MVVDRGHHVVDDRRRPFATDRRIDVEAAAECVVTRDADEDELGRPILGDEPLELDTDGHHRRSFVIAGEEVDHWVAALGRRAYEPGVWTSISTSLGSPSRLPSSDGASTVSRSVCGSADGVVAGASAAADDTRAVAPPGASSTASAAITHPL